MPTAMGMTLVADPLDPANLEMPTALADNLTAPLYENLSSLARDLQISTQLSHV